MGTESDRKSDRILVGLDGSAPSMVAAGAAIQIARARNAVIRGLYVVDERLITNEFANYQRELCSGETPSSRAELIACFEEQGSLALGWLEESCHASGVPVSTDLVLGDVPDILCTEGDGASLIVLGRRGHGHPGDPSHLGSNFRAVAHHTRRSVLAGGDEDRTIRRLLLAYNGSERSRLALTWASSLLEALAEDLVVLSVQEEGNQAPGWSAGLKEQLDGSNLPYRFQTTAGEPAAEIMAVSEHSQPDLLLMGGYRHTALLEWLTASTVDTVLRRSRLSVLIA